MSNADQSPNQIAPSGPICGSTGRNALLVETSRSSIRLPAKLPPLLVTVKRGMPFMLMTQA